MPGMNSDVNSRTQHQLNESGDANEQNAVILLKFVTFKCLTYFELKILIIGTKIF